MVEGVHVIGLSRSPEIDGGEGQFTPISVDLSDIEALPEMLESIYQRFPKIDLVINNAGFGILSPVESMDEASLLRQYSVMLMAPTLIARRAILGFRESACEGCLVNVSSLAVELPIPLMPIYNACKAGLSGLSDSLILDASGQDGNYTVIDFRPGDFNTEFAARMEGDCVWNGINLREVMDHHHAVAPPVELAVAGLRRALLRKRSGRVRVGDFFQSRVAPLGPRLFPVRWLQAIIRQYYRK